MRWPGTVAWAALAMLVVVACSDPPSAAVTRQAAARAVLGQQYDACVRSVRALRDTRNRHHHRVGRLRGVRDAAQVVLDTAPPARIEAARTALATAETALGDARARYEQDRAAIRVRNAECDDIQRRMHEH